MILLISPLQPDECAARIQAATDREGLLGWSGSRPVVGRVSNRSVRLSKRIGFRNSFQTFLVGRLEAGEDGTVFRGRTGMHPVVIALMLIWLIGIVLFGSVAIVAVIWGALAGVNVAGLMFFLLITLLVVGFIWFGRWLARDEERFLVSFVAGAIDARARPITSG